MSVCLILFVTAALLVWAGGGRFVRELRPSPLERVGGRGENAVVAGTVYKKEIKADYQVLYLKDNSIYYQKHTLKESKIIIYDKEKKNIRIGNVVKAHGELSFMERARNPGNFDEKAYYQRQDIHAKVWAEKATVIKKSVNKIWDKLSRIQQKWKVLIYDAIGQENGAVLAAMMLGDKADMEKELKNLYQVNGIGHILAISGLHLSFIGVGMYKLLRRITGSYAVGGAAGILFLLCYIIMIGLTVSALRAMVMFLFRVGADMAGRHYDAATALSFAAVVVMMWRPLYLYDGGFWLSFGAVAGVLLIVPIFEQGLLSGLWASVGIQAAILPILLYFFYEFPLYSPLLNLFVIPLMSVLLFLGIAGSALLMLLPGMGSLLLGGCQWIIEFYSWSCNVAVKLPYARIITGQPQIWQIIIYYAMLFLLVVWRRKRRKSSNKGKNTTVRNLAVSGALLLTGFLLFILPGPLFAEKSNLITMLDVGQGDGIFMKSASGITYFFDGGSSDIKQVWTYRIEPFLKYYGIDCLDYVFLSHGDVDHTNGIEEYLSNHNPGIRIRNLILPSQNVWDKNLRKIAADAQASGVHSFVMESGQTITDGNTAISCLGPGPAYSGEIGNASSLVLAIRINTFDMLMTGDVEGEGEKMLTEVLQEENRSWEVLKTAHHGSKNSTSQQFLDSMHPMYALISAGRYNRYGHPHEETLERLGALGCKIYNTQENGAVTISVKDTQMNIDKYLTVE